MKKILLLPLMALLCGCGAKADAAVIKETEQELITTRETLEAAKEVYVAEQDSNVVGAVSYYPTDDVNTGAIAGTNCLTLFFANENVVAASGKVALYEKDTSRKVAMIDVSDTERCVVSPLNERNYDYAGFRAGTQVDLYFDFPFEAGKRYYALLDPACFQMGRIFSKAVLDSNLIVFQTKDYGFKGDLRSVYHTNDFANFEINLGKTAQKAVITHEPEQLSIVHPEITKDTTEKPLITFLQEGNPSMTVTFYGMGDSVLDTVIVTYDVVHPDVEIEPMEEDKANEEAEEEADEEKEGEEKSDGEEKDKEASDEEKEDAAKDESKDESKEEPADEKKEGE